MRTNPNSTQTQFPKPIKNLSPLLFFTHKSLNKIPLLSSHHHHTMSTKIITLKTTQDDQSFNVEERVAMEFDTVRQFFDDNSDATDNTVPLPNVTGKQLSTVIEYCKNHIGFQDRGNDGKEESDKYDEDFMKELSNEELKELILAANFLNIKDFLDMLNQNAADRIKNKSVEYVRKFFGIENDFTEEEEQKIRSENPWAFEGVDPDD